MAKRKAIENEKEFLEILKTKFAIDEDFRAQEEQEVLDSYKQYLAVAETLEEGDIRSNLFIPVTYRQWDTVRSRLMKALFGSNPYVDFIPKATKDTDPETMLDNEIRAKIPAAVVNEQLTKNEIECIGWDFLTSVCFAKMGYLGVGWKKEKRTIKKYQDVTVPLIGEDGFEIVNDLGETENIDVKQFIEAEEITFDDNEIINHDWFDVWPDARGTSWNVKSWRHTWIREWKTQKQVKDKLAVLKQIGLGQVFDITEEEWQEIKNASINLQEGRGLRLAEIGKSSETKDTSDWDREGLFDDLSLVEVLNLYDDYGADYGMILGRCKLAYYGDTPYQRHKMIPLIAMPYDPLPNEINGQSFSDLLYYLQEEYNTNRNQRVDNRSLIINQQMGTTDENFARSAVINKPGAIHYLPQGQSSLWPIVPADTTGDAVQEEEILRRDMEDTVGTPAIQQGIQTPGQHTAYEMSQQNTNASSRFDVRILLYQTILRRLYMLMDLNNQQFLTDDRLIQIADEEGIKKWRKISPDEVRGEWNYVPAGASVDPNANKELRREQLKEAISMGKELGIQKNYEKMYNDLLKTFDIRNVEKYNLTPEEQTQMQQGMIQQQQKQIQAVQAEKQQEGQMKMQQMLMEYLFKIIQDAVKTNPAILAQLLQMPGMVQQDTNIPIEGGE